MLWPGLVIRIGVWGCPPLAHEKDAIRALGFASSFVPQMVSAGYTNVTCGVTTGTCFTGIVGDPARCEYVVVGHAVNMAARLMGKAVPGTVLCDEHTAERLAQTCGDTQITLDDPREIDVKGAEGIKVYEVTCALPNDEAPTRDCLHPPGEPYLAEDYKLTPMFGRETQLQDVVQEFEKVDGGSTAVRIGVCGPFGIGKTAFGRHVAAALGSFNKVFCSGYELERSRQWIALVPLIEHLLPYSAEVCACL